MQFSHYFSHANGGLCTFLMGEQHKKEFMEPYIGGSINALCKLYKTHPLLSKLADQTCVEVKQAKVEKAIGSKALTDLVDGPKMGGSVVVVEWLVNKMRSNAPFDSGGTSLTSS
ncbi:hypothetical protein Hanom_Chr14g01313671 [Helianthus anomalus]